MNMITHIHHFPFMVRFHAVSSVITDLMHSIERSAVSV